MISRREGGDILEKCENHYIKSYKKCEERGGVKMVQERCEIILEWLLIWVTFNYQLADPFKGGGPSFWLKYHLIF